MRKSKTGGPAFPVVPFNGSHWEGMTLRDYFAAKALNGLLAGEMELPLTVRQFCESAYKYADEMMKIKNAPEKAVEP